MDRMLVENSKITDLSDDVTLNEMVIEDFSYSYLKLSKEK